MRDCNQNKEKNMMWREGAASLDKNKFQDQYDKDHERPTAIRHQEAKSGRQAAIVNRRLGIATCDYHVNDVDDVKNGDEGQLNLPS